MKPRGRRETAASLGRGVQRFLIEQIRDTRLSIRGRPPASSIARPRLRERFELWWAMQGLPARAEVVAAHWRYLTGKVRPLSARCVGSRGWARRWCGTVAGAR